MSRRENKIRQEYGLFIKQYARKSKHINGFDPNDRSYSREMEELIKRIRPEELHRILNDNDDNK